MAQDIVACSTHMLCNMNMHHVNNEAQRWTLAYPYGYTTPCRNAVIIIIILHGHCLRQKVTNIKHSYMIVQTKSQD